MPRSEDVANMFMTGGRDGSMSESSAAPLEACQVVNTPSVLGFDLTGGHRMEPAGVCYDPRPDRESPKAVVDTKAEYDTEYKKK
jgi:hypothetical protein